MALLVSVQTERFSGSPIQARDIQSIILKIFRNPLVLYETGIMGGCETNGTVSHFTNANFAVV